MTSRDSLALAARGRAVRILIRNHQAEYDRIYGDEREAAGLPRKVGGKFAPDDVIALRRRITELEQQLANQEASA